MWLKHDFHNLFIIMAHSKLTVMQPTITTIYFMLHSEIRYLHTTIMCNSESPDRKLWFVNTKQMDWNHTSSNTKKIVAHN